MLGIKPSALGEACDGRGGLLEERHADCESEDGHQSRGTRAVESARDDQVRKKAEDLARRKTERDGALVLGKDDVRLEDLQESQCKSLPG